MILCVCVCVFFTLNDGASTILIPSILIPSNMHYYSMVTNPVQTVRDMLDRKRSEETSPIINNRLQRKNKVR